MAELTPINFVPVGKRFTLIVEVTDPAAAQMFVALALGIAEDHGVLVSGCKVLDVQQFDVRNGVDAMCRRMQYAVDVLSGKASLPKT